MIALNGLELVREADRFVIIDDKGWRATFTEQKLRTLKLMLDTQIAALKIRKAMSNRVEVEGAIFESIANAKKVREVIVAGSMLVSLLLDDGELLEIEGIPYNEGVAFFRSGWQGE